MRRKKRGESRRMRRQRPRGGWLQAAVCLVLLLGAFSVVTWRQTRGLELQRALDALEKKRAMAEAERVELVRRIEQLRARARIVSVAREELGMHVATTREIVFLPDPSGRTVAGEEPK